jgi:hypothetical protein
MEMERVKAKAEEDDHGRSHYDEFEPLAIQMENLEFKVVEAHGPAARTGAGPHSCAAALAAARDQRASEVVESMSHVTRHRSRHEIETARH